MKAFPFFALFSLFLLCTVFTSQCLAQTSEEDKYLWLESVDGEEALDWVNTLNEDTSNKLTKSRLFRSLKRDALSVLDSDSRIPELKYEGAWLYNYWRDDKNPIGAYRRTTIEQLRMENPKWETILDMDAYNKSNKLPEGQNWTFKFINCLPPKHQKCLVYLSPGGGDAVAIHEFDMVDKSFVKNGFSLPASKTRTTWRDVNTLYVGTNFGDGSMTESGYPGTSKVWSRGTPLEEARHLYTADLQSVSASAFRMRDKRGKIDLVYDRKSFWTMDVYLAQDDKLEALQLPADARINGSFQGKLLISLKQDWTVAGQTFTQGSVVLASPSDLIGTPRNIDLLIAPDKQSIIKSVHATPKGVLVSLLRDVVGHLKRYEPKEDGGWHVRDITLPDNGAIEVVTIDSESGNFLVRYESFTTPPTLYEVGAPMWQPRMLAQQVPSFDASNFEVKKYFAISADGTKVPYFVVMNRDTKFDGANPTHIFSYGGFRASLTPSYSGSYEKLYGAYGKLWLNRGGIFVSASIRGGGEYGPAWHQAGILENKHKSFEDFEAVVVDLIERRITSPKHLGIEGRSNGGLLVGGTMHRRPELYGAIICGSPLFDMKRYHKLLAGASWVGEYGNPDEPDQWSYIKTYSPYQNLAPNAGYPPTFFYTSTRDDRVHPGHARKAAARMMEYGYPVWYYENTEGGHHGSSTNEQLAHRLALSYTHLWNHLK